MGDGLLDRESVVISFCSIVALLPILTSEHNHKIDPDHLVGFQEFDQIHASPFMTSHLKFVENFALHWEPPAIGSPLLLGAPRMAGGCLWRLPTCVSCDPSQRSMGTQTLPLQQPAHNSLSTQKPNSKKLIDQCFGSDGYKRKTHSLLLFTL